MYKATCKIGKCYFLRTQSFLQQPFGFKKSIFQRIISADFHQDLKQTPQNFKISAKSEYDVTKVMYDVGVIFAQSRERAVGIFQKTSLFNNIDVTNFHCILSKVSDHTYENWIGRETCAEIVASLWCDVTMTFLTNDVEKTWRNCTWTCRYTYFSSLSQKAFDTPDKRPSPTNQLRSAHN